jgi:hypothetical protein
MALTGNKGKGKGTKIDGAKKPPTEKQLAFFARMPFLAQSFYKGKIPQSVSLAIANNKKTKPLLPKLNLLPPAIAFEIVRRRTKIILIGMGISVLFLSGAIWFTQGLTISQTTLSLAQAQAQVGISQKQANTYLPLTTYFNSLQARLDLANEKTANQLDYAKIFSSLKNAFGSSVTISTASIRPVTPDVVGTKNPTNLASQCGPINDPFTTGGSIVTVACVAFTGLATDSSQIPLIISRLASNSLFTNVSVVQTSQVASGVSITIAGSAAINQGGLMPVLAPIITPTDAASVNPATGKTSSSGTPPLPRATPTPNTFPHNGPLLAKPLPGTTPTLPGEAPKK